MVNSAEKQVVWSHYLALYWRISDRKVLKRKWVWDTCSRINELQELIESFVKCFLSRKLEKSENHLVIIWGMEDNVIPIPGSKFHLESKSNFEESEYDEGFCDGTSSPYQTFDYWCFEMIVIFYCLIKCARA